MRIGGHDQARDFGPHIRAPRIGVRQEEALAVGPAIRTLIVERLALLLQRGFQGIQRQMDAAVVGGVLSLRQQAVLLDSGAGIGDILRVFVGDALAAFVILFGVVGSPPVAQVAMRVELAALIVEAMDDFVADDHADGAVVHGIIFRWIEKWRLQNSGGEVDGVQLRIVVGVDRGRSHRPLGAIDGLADLRHPALELER